MMSAEHPMRCWLCPGDFVPARDIANHVRLMHPEVDAWPECGPSGHPIVYEDLGEV